MTQETQPEQSETRAITIELTWRAIAYLGGMFLLIFSFGMATYPLLPYASIWGFLLTGSGILLVLVTAPLVRKK